MDSYKIHDASAPLGQDSQFSTQTYARIAEDLVAPIDILQEARSNDPKFDIRRITPTGLTIMDKRHPSSFQQLDKVHWHYYHKHNQR